MAPTDGNLKLTLGRSYPLFEAMLNELHALRPDIRSEWHYSPRAGWHEIWLLEERRLFYLLPRTGGFRLNLILGDKALGSLKAGPYEAIVKRLLTGSKRYPEGTAFSFISETFEPMTVAALIEAKIEN